MPLYRVNLKTVVMVWRDIDDEAGVIKGALDGAIHELECDDNAIKIKEVKKLSDIPEIWRDSIPWGDDTGGSECAELFHHPERARDRQLVNLNCDYCENPAAKRCKDCGKLFCEGCATEGKCYCRE